MTAPELQSGFPATAALSAALAPHGLSVLALAPAEAGEWPGEEARGTVALIGPVGGSLWPVFSASPEYADGAADPLDRWSKRVLGEVAAGLSSSDRSTATGQDSGNTAGRDGGEPAGAQTGPAGSGDVSDQVEAGLAAETEMLPLCFPSDGPPYAPFQRWAFRSGLYHPSPVQIAIHSRYGLWTSFRGAVLLPDALVDEEIGQGVGGALPDPGSPCDSCADKPCLSACPVNAFAGGGFDQTACATYLTAPAEGAFRACWSGCLARRACPVGEDEVSRRACPVGAEGNSRRACPVGEDEASRRACPVGEDEASRRACPVGEDEAAHPLHPSPVQARFHLRLSAQNHTPFVRPYLPEDERV